MVSNLEWFADMSFLEFVRDIGRHFSVNRMLAAGATSPGWRRADFLGVQLHAHAVLRLLELFRRYNCRLQLGGNANGRTFSEAMNYPTGTPSMP